MLALCFVARGGACTWARPAVPSPRQPVAPSEQQPGSRTKRQPGSPCAIADSACRCVASAFAGGLWCAGRSGGGGSSDRGWRAAAAFCEWVAAAGRRCAASERPRWSCILRPRCSRSCVTVQPCASSLSVRRTSIARRMTHRARPKIPRDRSRFRSSSICAAGAFLSVPALLSSGADRGAGDPLPFFVVGGDSAGEWRFNPSPLHRLVGRGARRARPGRRPRPAPAAAPSMPCRRTTCRS